MFDLKKYKIVTINLIKVVWNKKKQKQSIAKESKVFKKNSKMKLKLNLMNEE